MATVYPEPKLEESSAPPLENALPTNQPIPATDQKDVANKADGSSVPLALVTDPLEALSLSICNYLY